jgi:transcriptional regulator with XRE-family HTH domain
MRAIAERAPAASGPPATARALRLLLGLSHRELGKLAGLDHQTIAAFEKAGRVRPASRAKIAHGLARGLEVEPATLEATLKVSHGRR